MGRRKNLTESEKGLITKEIAQGKTNNQLIKE